MSEALIKKDILTTDGTQVGVKPTTVTAAKPPAPKVKDCKACICMEGKACPKQTGSGIQYLLPGHRGFHAPKLSEFDKQPLWWKASLVGFAGISSYGLWRIVAKLRK